MVCASAISRSRFEGWGGAASVQLALCAYLEDIDGSTNRRTWCMYVKRGGFGGWWLCCMRVDVQDDVNGLENVVRWSEFGRNWGRWLMGGHVRGYNRYGLYILHLNIWIFLMVMISRVLFVNISQNVHDLKVERTFSWFSLCSRSTSECHLTTP